MRSLETGRRNQPETTDSDFTQGYIEGRTPLTGDSFYDLAYFTGERASQGIQYPHNGEYLNPESEYRYKFQDILSWMGKFVKKGRVLDVGTGPGHLSYWAQKTNAPFVVYGTDISQALLQSKYNQNPKRTLVSQVYELPFRNEVFDGVLFSDVLEHVWPRQAVLAMKEAKRVLKQNAYIFVNIPNRESWNDAARNDQGHVWLPNIKEVLELIRRGGFECEAIQTFTRGFPNSKEYREKHGSDLRLPTSGRSIFACSVNQ